MIEHFQRRVEMVPGSPMPPVRLADAQLNALAAYLLKLTPKNAEALQAAPDFAVEGAMVYQANGCGGCHPVEGNGMKKGAPPEGVGERTGKKQGERPLVGPPGMSAHKLNAPLPLFPPHI